LADGLLEALLALRRPVDLIVPAGTHVLASRSWLERLATRGQACFALTPLRAVALTVNPTAPDGREVEPAALRDLLQDAFPELPVIDVCVAPRDLS
jgi:hypothetical protein